ncbi:MAG: hypothetical protein AAF726_16605 [Planctomycetota bacterium]
MIDLAIALVCSGPVALAAPPVDVVGIAVDGAYESAFARAASRLEGSGLRAPVVSWDEPRVVSSRNYELRTTESRGHALRRARDLEDMLVRYQFLLGTDFEPRIPLVMLLHPNGTSYGEFASQYSDARSSVFGGFYDPSNPEGAAAAIHSDNVALERMHLTHAAVQQYVARAFPNVELEPALTQGLGAYFQSFWDYRYFVDRYLALRDGSGESGLIPLRSLLNDPIDAYPERGADRLFQLAMLFVYLRHFKEETKSNVFPDGSADVIGPFENYLRRRLRGEDVANDPIQRLFSTELDLLEAEMLDFDSW